MSVELENKWALAVKENADLRQQLAEARAENETKDEEIATLRSHHHDAEQAFDKFAESQDTLAAQAAELATLRERLAAAERIIGSNGLLRVGNADIVDAQCDGKYEVENSETGDVLGEENDDEEIEARLFDDWYEAYQAAIAAGLIPPSTKGEG